MDDPEANDKDVKVKALDEDDIALLKTYGLGPYSDRIKSVEADVKRIGKEVNDICGIKESDTGLAPPSRWDLVSDKQAMQEEQPLQARALPVHRGEPSRRCSRRSRACDRPAARSRCQGPQAGWECWPVRPLCS